MPRFVDRRFPCVPAQPRRTPIPRGTVARVLLCSLTGVLLGCGGGDGAASGADSTAIAEPAPVAFQAISKLGDTLRTLPLSDSVRARYERQMADAKRAYEQAPTDADSIIWYARRLGYLGRSREAIEIYGRGIALDSMNPWYYRHRGHRYISVREFELAIADLERAAQLVDGKPDIVEPDGQPNAQNTPIGTLHSNINYHLALAYYLNGNYEKAIPIYQRDLATAANDDRRVSTTHWLYMSLRRAGRDAEAEQAVAPVTSAMTVIENDAYYRLNQLYKGMLPPDSVLKVGPTGEMSVTDATAAYGVANWHLASGRTQEGQQLLQRIVDGGQWGAFGFIAAEVDLARLRGSTVQNK